MEAIMTERKNMAGFIDVLFQQNERLIEECERLRYQIEYLDEMHRDQVSRLLERINHLVRTQPVRR